MGSRSGSIPRSSSVASGSASSSIVPPASDPSESIAGPSKLSKQDKDLLLGFLGIDTELPYLGPPGLCSAYQKFKAITNATSQVMGLSKNAEWKAQFSDTRPWIPTIVHFIDIFVAKSQFYQIWKPMFSRAQEYPAMKDWLNQHDGCVSTKELWNEDSKRAITFTNLKKWLEIKDREVEMKQLQVDGKGKRKVPPSPQKLKTKKHDNRDRPVVQRKHKKIRISKESEEEETE